jgi:hypothetical protein
MDTIDAADKDYWSQERMTIESINHIVLSTNALVCAFGCDPDIPFPEIIKWLVELKIKIIKSEMCKYCNSEADKCKCATTCVSCNTTDHISCYCKKHIMNSPLFKILFESANVKKSIGI